LSIYIFCLDWKDVVELIRMPLLLIINEKLA